jgi:hypothetical protein
MGKIYSPPKEVKVPVLDWKNIPQYEKDCQTFKEDLKKFLKERGYNEEHTGVSIYFPFADGQAEYMVMSLKPVRLIHIPIWDAWEYPYIDRLTKKDIEDKIKQQISLSKLFPKR